MMWRKYPEDPPPEPDDINIKYIVTNGEWIDVNCWYGLGDYYWSDIMVKYWMPLPELP